MPEQAPNYPSEDLLARASEYRNVQAEIDDFFKKQNVSIKDIVDINKRVEKGLLQRLAVQRSLTDSILKDKAEIAKAQVDYDDATSQADKKSALSRLRGFQQDLHHHTLEYDLLTKINQGALIPMFYLFDKIWKLFKSMDTAAANFRMRMGVVRENVERIRSTAQKLAVDFMHVGVNVDRVYDAFVALGKEMGGIRLVSIDLVKATALLKSQLGIAEEDSADFFKNMAAISKSTMQTQENMAYIAQDFAQTAGVPLASIMKDIAKLSSVALTMISRVPNQILRAAIEAKRMNTSINEMARGSRDILNFSESIAAEMEASVLLGRSINLQRARELAYNRDLVGSTKEILRIAKQIDFENLDVFQMDAFARATGRSVDELLNMLQAQRQLDAARRSADPAIRAQVKAIDDLMNANEALVKSRAKDIQYQLQIKANQERLVAISQKWNAIVAKAGEIFLPVIDALLSIVPAALDVAHSFFSVYAAVYGIGSGIRNIGLSIAKLFPTFSTMSEFFVGISKYGKSIVSIANMMVSPFAKVGQFFISWLGPLAKFAPALSRMLGPIGLLIMAGEAIGRTIMGVARLYREFVDDVKKLGIGRAIYNSIAGSIGLVGSLLYDMIVKPIGKLVAWVVGFASKDLADGIRKGLDSIDVIGVVKGWANSFWTWLKPFLGQSPSELGLLILKGIASVGPMIFDAFTAPFRDGLAWIVDKIPGMNKVADKLRGGLSDIINKPLESKVTSTYVPVATITPNGTKLNDNLGRTTSDGGKETIQDNGNGKALNDILNAINQLNSNLESGKIGIYIDGQLLSSTLSRQTEFRGGFGVNKI